MIYDFLTLKKHADTPLYVQLYSAVKNAIENGALKQGEKLPSIRRLSEDLALSRTTVENAYQQLCTEGYIKSMPQRGFFIQSPPYPGMENTKVQKPVTYPTRFHNIIKYDFSSKSVDVSNSNLKLWRKYVRNVINCDYLITSYGNPQGELELRRALASYCYGVRGVQGDERNIVIGAGTQSLLYLICGLLHACGSTVAVEADGSAHAMQVFSDCGMHVVTVGSDCDGIVPDALKASGARLLLINPSGSLRTGNHIKMNRRYALLRWAEAHDAYIIEDDYNGELRYKTRPIPALQGYDSRHVIYLGSFSKLLLPSVRIGYAVLPEALSARFSERAGRYNQTASKAEQLALAKYISDGQLERHLRRLRKQYHEKSLLLCEALQECLPCNINITLLETALTVVVELPFEIDGQTLYRSLLEQGVRIIQGKRCGRSFKLGFSGIPCDKIRPAVEMIADTIKKHIPQTDVL